MKKDITSRKDIETLVNMFYEKVQVDETIGFFFTEVVKVNWVKHLPLMYDFWDNAIFYSGKYQGNPLEVHKHLHQICPLTYQHFDTWLSLFLLVLDSNFEGANANVAKQRATSITDILKLKIVDVKKAQ